VEFRVLGPLEVADDAGGVIDIPGAKLRALLGVLVLRAGQPVSADRLADVLWGEDPPAAAANALQAQVSKLRKTLGTSSAIDTRDGGYALNIDPACVDANRFTDLAAAGKAHLDDGRCADAAGALREALELWRGPALADFLYDDFANAERTRLDELRLGAIEDRVEADLALGHHEAVIAELEVLVTESPLRERLWGQLMLALYRSGRQVEALRAYQRIKEHLADELGLDPGPELTRLERLVLEHDRTLSPPSTAAQRPRLTNIQPEISTFVGRDADLAELDALVRTRRLVTLTGPGGVGKTRLAMETALRTQDRWRDGTWLVELGPWAGESALGEALARTFGPRLGVSVGGRASLHLVIDWLVDGLSSSELLIVFDNCEHVLDAVAAITGALVRACREVHVLATRRQPLGTPGEIIRPVEPLGLDDAVRLFASRAGDASPTFVLDATSAASVETICSRVDRLPLAIELTAARTRAFSPPQLAELLDQRLGLASTASTARPARHQTLQAAVDWSYELLFADERRLLARLSVFAGGFTLEAATAVCAGEDLVATDIGVVLARLIDKSLVAVIPGSRPVDRFRLLRSVAEFAAGRLDESSETAATRDRHAAWFVHLTSGLTAGLRSIDHLRWARRINAELANLGRCAQWGLSGGAAAPVLEIGANLGWYGFLSANLLDDEPVLLELLERAHDAPPELRCRAMMWAGLLSIGRTGARTWAMDAIDVARTAATSAAERPFHVELDRHGLALSAAAIAAARELGDTSLLADALALGALHLAGDGSDPGEVLRMVAEARELGRTAGDEWQLALVTAVEALAQYGLGELHEAARLLAGAIARFRELGDDGTAGLFEISLSEVVELYGDVAGAAASMQRAVEMAGAAGYQSAAVLTSVLAWLAGRNGEIERALALGESAVSAAHRPFNPVTRAQALFALGVAELAAGRDDEARDHLHEAFAIHERYGMARELAMDHTYVGRLSSRAGDDEDALGHHIAAITAAVGVGLPWTVMLTACGLAETLVATGRADLGCRTIGLIEAISERHGYPLVATERAQVDGARRLATAVIGEGAAADAEQAGALEPVEALLQRVAQAVSR
jgi:predicted ATPase/DNA-binding SARP family transcriptional activator